MVEKLRAVVMAVEAYTVEIFALDAFSNAEKRVLVRKVDPDIDDT
jgi:hypothetical protein